MISRTCTSKASTSGRALTFLTSSRTEIQFQIRLRFHIFRCWLLCFHGLSVCRIGTHGCVMLGWGVIRLRRWTQLWRPFQIIKSWKCKKVLNALGADCFGVVSTGSCVTRLVAKRYVNHVHARVNRRVYAKWYWQSPESSYVLARVLNLQVRIIHGFT